MTHVLKLCAVLCLCGYLNAQEFRASLTGRITDPTGAGIGEASIQIKHVSSGAVSTTTSSTDGSYFISFLIPGEYSMTVEKTGFRRSVQEGIRLQIAERGVLDVGMTLGEVSQSVTVAADTALVETESADRGLTIESKRVLNTPLQGRNIFAQAWSAPGVTVTAAVQRLRPFDIAGSSGIAVSGGRPNGNEVLIDGVSNLSRGRDVAYVPTAEATAEFRVQTTSYDAQYGWTTGGVINITTKSGGNQWHGSAFEFLQNTHLNANTFNANRNGVARSSSNINTFGGDISGPIVQNKLFFQFSYENIRQVIPDPFVTSVPTALQRSGDFSATQYALNSVQTIYDPFSTRAGPTGALIRDPFPGNRIPGNRISPIARNVFNLIPEGNVPGNAITGLNNLVSTGSTRKFTDFFPEYTGRVDYNISERTRMFVRYSRNALAEERGFVYSTTSTLNVAETSGNTPFKRENHSSTIQLTHTLNPQTVLDFRLGLARFLAQSGNSIGAGYDLAGLGFDPQFVGQAVPYFPRFTWAGSFAGAGSSPINNDPIAQTNSFQMSLARSAGRHSMKTGAEFRLQRAYHRNPGFVAGNFTFDQTFTGRDPLRSEPASGNALASFLLGTPQSGFIDVNSQRARQQRLWSFFVQDDIRVTSKLKLNLGLRWDYLGPMTDRFDALTRGFDTESASPLQVPGVNLRGGLNYVGVGGQDRGLYDKDWNNFGPRIGVAYQLTPKTILRGGYGLIYAQTYDDPGDAPGFNQRTAMVSSIQTGIPENTLANPFPEGVLQPFGSSQGLSTFLGQGFSFSDPGRVVPWTHQFSFEIQRELPGQFLVTAAYVGSRLRGISVTQGFNEIPRDAFNLGAAELTRNVANPLAGAIPGTALNGATVQRQQLLRPYIQFLGINELNRSEGTSRYDSFQLMVYKRLSAGLNFSVSYTNSKTLDQVNYANAQDTELEKVVAPWDIPQSLQINGVYELPFGRGKPFGASVHPILQRFIGGWEISGIARIQGGMPMNVPGNAVPTGGDPTVESRTLDRWFNTCTQLPNGSTRGCLQGEQPVWTIRQPFVFQTWSTRLASIRRPSIRNLDVSVIKNNPITERVNLIFRTDFLNATNTPQFFNGPIVDANNPNFGRIAGAMDQSNLPRFIQISLKLQF
ncbi:MAG: TonB-dependent receptor [Bryobacteraceae bacterium]